MSSKKKSLPTPLHLLQELSGGLVAHLENACAKAMKEAERILGKLEKERGKAQAKLRKNRVNFEKAAATGKSKAQKRAKQSIAELEDMLDGLKDRQTQTLQYITDLKRDAQESISLAEGVNKVRDAVSKVIHLRNAPPAAAKTVAPKAAVRKAAAAKPAAKPAAKAPARTRAPAKPRAAAAKPAASTTVKPATSTAAKPAAKPAAARKPAVRRPAAKPAAVSAAAAEKPAI